MKIGIWITLLAFTASVWAAPDLTLARIAKIEPEKARVTLKHQRIKSIGMEAMTMPFKVEDSVDLAPFKVGQKVRFTVAEKNSHLVVDWMEPAK
jgi:Cu/Ag efflux protein CusF